VTGWRIATASLITPLAAIGIPTFTTAPAAQPVGPFDAWVSFTDKGFSTERAKADAYLQLERTFNPRALERRRKRRTLPGLFDDHDLPLHTPYLEGVAATGAEVRVESRWLNGVTVLATQPQLDAVAGLPFVEEVRDIHAHVPKGERAATIPRDRDLRGEPSPEANGLYGWSGPQIHQLNLPLLHDAGFRGAGVRIGVVDTGFLLSHEAFRNPAHTIRLVVQWDFMDNDSVVAPEPGDSPVQHEHGTLVLGTLAANLPGSLVGSAPDAEFILLKAEDEATEYFLEERWFAAALEFAEAQGVDVVTSSVVLYEGYDMDEVDGRTSVMAQAWTLAAGNGVIGLQGAGNAGHDQDPSTHHLLPPAAVAEAITVGAVDPDGEVASFSSDGLAMEGSVKPELLAWGRETSTVSPYDFNGYTTSSGTSLTTPLLAGAVACVLQAHPDWTVGQTREALFRSGAYFLENGRPDPLSIQGYGLPDLARAAGLAEGVPPVGSPESARPPS
jgi:subtilisin family serine protease